MFLWIIMILGLTSRYIRVPAGKILVVFGKTETGHTETYLDGATFVWPVLQDYDYLDLTPLEIKLEERFASMDNIPIPIKSKIIFAISTKEEITLNAVDRLSGLENSKIQSTGLDIIKGVMRSSFSEMNSKDIANYQHKAKEEVSKLINKEINRIGLELISLDLDFSKLKKR